MDMGFVTDEEQEEILDRIYGREKPKPKKTNLWLWLLRKIGIVK